MKHRRLPALVLVASLVTLLPAGEAKTSVELPHGNAPVPTARPDSREEAAFAAVTMPDNPTIPALRPVAPVLAAGLTAAREGRIAMARQLRDSLPAGAFDREILSWALALSGDPAVTSGEIAAVLHGPLPGKVVLRRHFEEALAREQPEPRAVLATFAEEPPQTRDGILLLARAHRALGDDAAATRTIAPFWHTAHLGAREEAAILAEFGSLLAATDHRRRMEQMLHDERVSSALRVAGRAGAGARALAEAWAAVIRSEARAGALLDAVPEAARSGGYIFAKARHLRRNGQFRAAAEIMLSAPRHADLLVDPDAWWFEQRVLSRELIDIGEAGLAYRVAARHAASSPAAVADAEFHAGWYALGMLEKPHLAARHFHRIAEVADGPISRARAFYWLGRAAEAGGPGKADDLYAEAARYGTAFYGQLAAHALGHETIAIARPEPNAADRAAFAMRPAVWAIRRLQAVGHGERTGLIYRELARTLRRPGEIDLLAEMAENAGGPAAVLRLAKIAARRGLEIGALAHPVGAIPASARLSGAGRALAYAVARQESEFDPAAVSGAGARGLLQLMPATARDMARRAGLPFSSQRLVTDPGYNATLGATYLANQLDRFDGSYILTLVAYNAGPRRAHDWMARYGDPRGRDLAAVIDWLERIPFTETRNYVQRVMENYQVYRMQLTGQADIGGALGEGRR